MMAVGWFSIPSRNGGAWLRALVPLLVAFALVPAPSPAQEYALLELSRRNHHERQQVLLSHGINTDSDSLVNFLESGFPDAARRRGLPTRPQVKSEVVNAAIQELGYRQSRRARDLFVQMLRKEMPGGVRSIVMQDTEIFPIEQAMERRELTNAILRLNAIVALGLIGDRSAANDILAAMEREVGGDFVTEGAIALALLEDSRGLEPLLRLARRVNPESLRPTFAAIFFVTGNNYGATENTSVARREKLINDFARWMENEGRNFVPSRADVLRRRSVGYIIPPPPMDSLRGLLKGSRTFDNYDTRYTARQQLQMMAPSAVEELREIAMDPMEDIDIRWAAMDWFAATNPREARSTVRNIARRDDNPRLRERAEVLRDEIEIAIRRRR